MGGLLRFYQIGSKGLWIDEAFSIWMGQRPVDEMLEWLVRIDQHPPLYYTLLHIWMGLGDTVAHVRTLSALFGTLTIPAVYLTGHRLADGKVGLLAALLLAVSPFHVRFAQEARMYALLALNASLALVALTRLLTDPRAAEARLGQQLAHLWRTRRDTHRWLPLRAIETDLAWLCYVAFTVATLLSHNTAVFFLVAANLFVLGLHLARVLSHNASSPRPARLRKPFAADAAASPETTHTTQRAPSPGNWLLAQVGVCLLWCPWLPALIVQSNAVYRDFWLPAPTWETMANVIGAFVSDCLPLRPAAVWAVGTMYLGLALLGLAHFRRRSTHIAFLLTVFLTPIVGERLVSLRRPIFYDRTLIWASLPLYLLLAAGVRYLRRWPTILTAVVVVSAINGLSLREYYAYFEKEGWDKAAALVAERAAPADVILFSATWAQIPFDHYFHRQYNRSLTEHGVPVDLFERSTLEPKMAKSDVPRLRVLIEGRERVWLVYGHESYTDPEGLIPAALEQEFDLLDRWDFRGLQVRLYGARE